MRNASISDALYVLIHTSSNVKRANLGGFLSYENGVIFVNGTEKGEKYKDVYAPCQEDLLANDWQTCEEPEEAEELEEPEEAEKPEEPDFSLRYSFDDAVGFLDFPNVKFITRNFLGEVTKDKDTNVLYVTTTQDGITEKVPFDTVATTEDYNAEDWVLF